MSADAPPAPLRLLGDPQAVACEGDACLVMPQESTADDAAPDGLFSA